MVRLPRGVGIGLFLILLQLFLYINADYVYGPFAAQIRNVLLIYILMLTFLLAALRERLPTLADRPKSLGYMALGLLITYPLAFLLNGLVTGSQPQGSFVLASFETVKLAVSFGLLHGFVKAYIEEISFRSLIMDRIGNIGQAFFFGIFHASLAFSNGQFLVESGRIAVEALPFYVLQVFIILGTMGFVWGKVKNKWGIMGATGSHWGWNLAALGVKLF